MNAGFGQRPQIVRTASAGALTGVAPVGAAAKPFELCMISADRLQYADPDDHSVTTLVDGGLILLDDPVALVAIHAYLAGGGTFTLTLEERNAVSNAIILYSGEAGDNKRLTLSPGVVVTKNQQLKLETDAGGEMDLVFKGSQYTKF